MRGEEPSWIVHETDDVVCFLPETCSAFGHTLIVPKQHFADLYDIPETLLGKLAAEAKNLSLSYRDKIGATGVNLLHASGVDGDQSIFHFHFHLLPRFPDDGLVTWPDLRDVASDRDTLLKRLTGG
jgi:histidine triad (HIT) family protein